MVNTNKILTVSYGTFSCTLEGFEDSFGTMKAIAEYFRDLAADDRYFGAEPPTPDAEMLARIAEREIARRVQANIEEGNITLRAEPGSILPVAAAATAAADPALHEGDHDGDVEDNLQDAAPADQADAAPPATTPVADADAETSQSEVDTATAEAPVEPQSAPAAAAQPEAAFETPADAPEAPRAEAVTTARPAPIADPESVAAKLSRIRAVVAQSDGARHETAPNSAPYSEDEHADALAEDFLAEDFLADAHEDIEAALNADDQAETARTHEADTDDSDQEDDIAALLDRYGAEGHHIFDEAEEDADSADDPARAEADTEDHIAKLLATGEAETAEADTAAEAAPAIGAVGDDLEDDLEDVAQDADIADDADRIYADAAVSAAEDGYDDTHEDDEAASAAEAPVPVAPAAAPLRARVIKMKRADFEAAIASGEIEEDIEDERADQSQGEPAASFDEPAFDSDSSLSADDEADLMRELAAVEAELAGDLADDDTDDARDAAPFDPDLGAEDTAEDSIAAMLGALDDRNDDDADDEDDGQDSLLAADDSFDEGDEELTESLFDETDDEDEGEDHDDDRAEDAPDSPRAAFADDAEHEMSRIFEATDEQMAEETGKGRRNAIAHLRAAVMAAKAEERTGGRLAADGPDTEAYRDDLASVVRPRRPEAGKTHTRRPDAPKPAPLKLVAEQRIDVADDRAAPVRPRRVARPQAAMDDQAEAGNFAEYAESVGAVALPELLEAAAAYLSFVEGRDQFSRPQLMTQVRQVEKDDFSREDGLRSFGKLLRDGKIEKLEGGRFKASESISYRPDARYAGE